MKICGGVTAVKFLKKLYDKENCMKKIIVLLAGLFGISNVMAQETSGATTFWDDPVNHPLAPVYLVSLFVFIVILLVLVVTIAVFRVLRMLTQQVERERAERLGIAYVTPVSWWGKMMHSLTDSVPVEKEADIDLGHNYDGIRELDNHLPPWWKWLFYFTIGWGAVYLVVYHITGTLPLSEQEYVRSVALAEQEMQKFKESQPKVEIDANTLQYTSDAAIIEKGKTVFMNNNCGACHRNDGGGNTIGPNLTDEYWIHGGDIKSIFATIKDGAVEKGMPAWGKSMSTQDVRDVTFFVMSLRGTNPPDAKAPQGEPFKEVAATPDSVKVQASL